uniref:RWD domain-containing protein n=1 Tax=Psilocybe cubensis TaxID=181762 RepID=A0A8H7YBD1_PSICU
MSGFRSSSPSRSKAESLSNTNHQTESTLAARRPSWTPSITEPEDSRFQSRRRSKHSEENLSDWAGSASALSKSRRPSFPPPITEGYQRARRPRVEHEESPEIVKFGGTSQPASEGKSLYSSWEINVKDLVGDAVGNVSRLLPTSASTEETVDEHKSSVARRGLFIIDLDYPLRIPRFLPQGGTWDVADVQWNPHPSHAQYIVSTSSEKLLIWNLRLGGKTSIEHILKSHYRAITDINWHTTECDIVVSTGIDSWIWAWDLREPNKPIFGLSAFKAGGTQVKWNYQDGNLLASSHSNEVLIWDRRKGSLPITRIRAHSSKIYGIDWSRTSRDQIVTCSLDKSIKTWNINAVDADNPEPESYIRTTYPVWRARNLPFGEGILSLPQRGETTLEMYAKSDPHAPVEVFEGHSDVVKEFVWRKGDQDDFQLITWSKDRTLRFWPIDGEAMQKVGHNPQVVRGRSKLTRSAMEYYDTFRNPPDTEAKETYSTISAPIGNRGILAEVRALHPSKGSHPIRRAFESNLSSRIGDEHSTPTTRSIAFVPGRSVGGTMSKGGTGIKNAAQLDQLTWLANVKVGSKRGSSSGGGSHGASRPPSRLRSGSRPPSGHDRSISEIGGRQRSGSLSRALDDRKEADNNQSLQEEITTVLTKLAASKIKLEKHDLTKKRTCTLGLHGPWGETSSVFMRVTFTFPRDYPYSTHPHGTPAVELERNPLISMRARTYILKHLRRIRERKRPCLEACLRFLLFADEGHTDQDFADSESSSDDDQPSGKKPRDITVSLLRNNKNLAEPRTSQGAFGPNGELICFFRAPPRIVRNVLRDLTGAGNKATEEPSTPQPQDQPLPPPVPQPQQKKSYFQSPALVSDAVRRLGLAATDRTVQPIDPKRPEAELNILRAMTNLLTMPQQRRRDSDAKQPEEVPKNYALFTARRSTVFLTSTRDFTGADQKVTSEYIFMADSLAAVCDTNANVARRHGRFDHERIFKTLGTLFNQPDIDKKAKESSFVSDSLAASVIKQLYSNLVIEKDVQMLAMIAMLVLQTEHGIAPHPTIGRRTESFTPVPHVSIPSRLGGMDYFSLTKAINPSSPISPAWPRLPSPATAPLAPSVSSSNSSRGSWSSLFNTGSAVRQFMNGMQDTFKDGLTTPTETMPTTPSADLPGHGASRSAEKPSKVQDPAAQDPRKKRIRKDSSFQSPTPVSKSWNDGTTNSSKIMSSSFFSAGQKNLSSNLFMADKRRIRFEPLIYEETYIPSPVRSRLDRTIQAKRIRVFGASLQMATIP